jgi:tRNA(Ile2) C34 agmatinyltransferase TiaS
VTARWLVCIDDTDNEESIGTGRLARMLAAHLGAEQLLGEASITRHQLLVDPRIPYTSHNSSACLEAAGPEDAGDALLQAGIRFLQDHRQIGANPGLCVCRADAVPAPFVELGRRAQREVLDLAAFDALLPRGVRLWSSGDTGQGRIGAVSGVGLRSTGDDGRFIGLAGIRDLRGRLRAGEILARSGVAAVETESGASLPDDAFVETRDWVRPTLRAGRPVLVVRDEDGHLVPSERRSKDD